MVRLTAALEDRLPDELVAVGEVEVVVDSGETTAGSATVPQPRDLRIRTPAPRDWS
jgi:hypothetical protein